MPYPIYLIAGQSNAGSLSDSFFYDHAPLLNDSSIVTHYFEGGTSLYPSLMENDWYPVDDGLLHTGELYDGLIAHIDTILAQNPDSYLAGIIWVQGEADTGTAESATSYLSRITALIDGLRAQYGTSFEFLDVALSQHAPWATARDFWSMVREAQLTLASAENGITVIDPDVLIEQLSLGETAFRDGVHYSREFSDALLRYAFAQFEHETPFDLFAPMFGTADADVMVGTSTTDHIRGLAGSDRIDGGEGDDRLFGGSDNDLLFGDAGNDLLDGGTGTDEMAGASGDDVYIVDDAADTVTEMAGAGVDTVISAISHSLALHVENLRAAEGAGGLVLTGNSSANEITGGNGDDALDGGGAADILSGNGGDDVLLGGDGADTLDGGSGTNILAGGSASDRYRVRSSTDLIQEHAGGGYDTATFFVSYVLPTGVELEKAIMHEGAGAGSFTGNEFANLIYGNAQSNSIDGGTGDDQLMGGAGNDYLVGGSGVDTIDGGDGDDVAVSDLDGDIITGGGGTDRLTLFVEYAQVRIFADGSPENLVIAFQRDGETILTRLSGIEFIDFTDASLDVLETEFFANQLPEFSTVSAASVVEGSTGTGLIVAATDPEGADISYVIAQEGDGALFAIAADGTLTFISEPNFEAPTDAGGDNIYDLVLIASDGVGETRLAITVTVNDLYEAPAFMGPAAISVSEGKADAGLIPTAIHPEGRTLTYAIADEGDGALFELDPDGKLRFIAAPNFEAPTDANGDNVYDLVLVASDGVGETRLAIAVTVADVDEAPVFTGEAAIILDEGNPDTGLAPTAIDPEGNALTYAIANEGDGALFALGSDGTLHFITAPDFEAPNDAGGDNIYNLVLIASDGVKETRLDVAITVADVNPEYVFSASGTLISKTVRDISDDTGWQIATTYYFANGKISGRYLLLDNNDAKEFHFDTGGNMIDQILIDETDRRPWDRITIIYDAAKSVSQREILLDDGDLTTNYYSTDKHLTERIFFDGDNDVSWLRDIYQYETDGSVISRQLYFDSGRWDSFTYDTEGLLIERVRHNVDGSTLIL